MADDLLPSNATALMRSLSRAQGRVLDVDMDVIRRSVLAHSAEARLLPWRAWDRPVDEWVDSWPEESRREVVFGSFAYHRVKGTPAALERALAQLDYETVVTEWFQYGGDAYKFRVSYEIPENSTYTVHEWTALLRLINTAKNVRSKLDTLKVRSSARAPAPRIAAYWPRRTVKATLYPDGFGFFVLGDENGDVLGSDDDNLVGYIGT